MFIANLLTVAEQVFILFLLILVGFICGKAKLLGDGTVKQLSTFCLYFATPAVIVKSFIREFDPATAKSLLFAVIAATLCHLVGIVIGTLFFRRGTPQQIAVCKNSVVLSNAGFMGLPLQAAILGSTGVFYGTAYATVLTVFLWTYCFSTMSCGKEKMDVKKIMFNPGIIAVALGLPLFIFSYNPPEIFTSTLTHLGNLNTPLPMVIVGYYLAKTDIKKVFARPINYFVIATRLLVVPLVCLGLLFALGYRDVMLIAMIIAASAPIAVAVTMFAARFEGDAENSANVVSVSTLLSIITMPLIVALAQTLA